MILAASLIASARTKRPIIIKTPVIISTFLLAEQLDKTVAISFLLLWFPKDVFVGRCSHYIWLVSRWLRWLLLR
jgi:hypothetical protein